MLLDRRNPTAPLDAPRAGRVTHPRTLATALLALLFSGACGESSAPPPATADVANTGGTPAPVTITPSAGGASAQAEPKVDITLEQLLDVHRSYEPRAIDGNRFVYLSDAPGTAQLFMADAGLAGSGGEGAKVTPRQITSYPDRLSAARVAPDGKRAVFMKDTGGDENDQLFLISLGGSPEAPAVALTDAPKIKHTLPSFDDTGARIAYTSNARNGKDMDLYVEALPAGDGKAAASASAKNDATKKAPLVELTGSHTVQDWKGDKIAVIEARSSFDQDLWIVDAKTRKKTLLSKHTGDERYGGARFSRDGRAVFVLTDAGREYMGLVSIDIASGKRTPIVAEEHDVTHLAAPSHDIQAKAPDKGAKAGAVGDKGAKPAAAPRAEDVLAFAINKEGIEEVFTLTLDAGRKAIARTPLGERGVVRSIDVAPAGDAVFVALERSTLPTEVFRMDIAKGTSARVTHSHHGGIDESKLIKEEVLSFPSFDKRPISLLWYAMPAQSGKKRPVIIQIHGGPEGQSQPAFNPVTQYFALHGYAVALPNVRGSTGYGKSFSHLDDKEKREDSVRDLSEVGKFLAGRPDVDPARLVLYGGSYGGYMVLAGLTLYPEQWAAGIDVVGIANFRTFLEQTAPYRRALREAEYGSLATDGAMLDRVSPIHRVDQIRAPLMVIHGTRDPRVPIGEARQIADAVKKRGLPVELLTFDDEGHGLSKRKNRLVAYPAVVAFLDKHVKGKR